MSSHGVTNSENVFKPSVIQSTVNCTQQDVNSLHENVFSNEEKTANVGIHVPLARFEVIHYT